MSDRCRKSNDTFATMNNNFWGHLTSSLVKIIGKSSHSWPKIVIHGDSCIILYICMCFFYNEGTLPCSPHFPSICEPEFQYRNRFSVSITHCVILVIQTGPILPATGIHGMRVPMCSCVRKSKQMLLALIRCSRPWIDGHSSIQCLYWRVMPTPMMVRPWRVTVERLELPWILFWGTIFQMIMTCTGTDLMFLSRLGSTIQFMSFESHDPIMPNWIPCYTEPYYKGSLL